jgi:hypothetical protein
LRRVRRSECFNGDADLGAIPSLGTAYYARFVEQTVKTQLPPFGLYLARGGSSTSAREGNLRR